MNRMTIFAALAGSLLIGCGREEEAPRFVPAGPDAGASRPSSDDATRTVAPPKNIATH